jgi:type II secretory pathway component GspD/PulD (secretin)
MWLVAALMVAGCKSKQPDEPSGDETMEGVAAPHAETMEEKTTERSVEQDAKDVLASRYVELGNAARQRGDWEGAQKHYALALEEDPNHAEARKRLDEVSANLGLRPGTVRDALDAGVAEREVRRQAAQMEISDLVRVGGQLEKQGEFARAIRNYEKAQLIVGLYPYYADFNPGAKQIRDMIARATNAKVAAEKARRDAEYREAREMAELDERRQREARDQRIAQLFRDANLAMDRLRYDVAREYAEQILLEDPTNETAKKLHRIARAAKLTTEEAEARRDSKEQWRQAFLEVEKAATPQVQPVIFPKEWTTRQALRKGYGVSRGAALDIDPRVQEIENVLSSTMVNINFDETSLRDAVGFLAQYANLNIIVLPSVDEEKSEEELLVSLRAENISVRGALELITLTKGLSFRIDNGVVQIGTEAEALGEMILDLYDVKDLTVPIKSFPGQDINLTPSGGFGFFTEEEEIDPIQAFEGDALADLIRDTIDTNVWDEGGDVAFREGGILLVRAPRETHARVQGLLDGLRATGGLTVTLETRFITVQDGFLQDIGVDIRGLGDQSGGVGLAGKGQTRRFDDVLTGTQNAPLGIGTDNFSGVFYNLNSDGDVRGRVENLLDVALGQTGLLAATGGTSIQATYLDDTQLEVVLRAVEKSLRSSIVVAPKITVYNHERANVTVLNQVSYIQDFDVEIAQAAQIGDPIVQTLRDGVILDVTPIVSADRKFVTLELRPTIATLQRPIQTFSTTLGNGPPVIIQLPELRIQRVRTTVTMPDGGILLLGGLKYFEEERLDSSVPWINKIPILSFFWSRKGTYISRRNLIVLIKAQILVLEEMEPRYGGQ